MNAGDYYVHVDTGQVVKVLMPKVESDRPFEDPSITVYRLLDEGEPKLRYVNAGWFQLFYRTAKWETGEFK